MSATDLGTDLLDGVVYGAAYVDMGETAYAAKIAARFPRTPVFTEVPRGRACNIGQGVFLHRCHECDDYVRSYGGILYIPALEAHERKVHGIVQGPLLPAPRRGQGPL